MISLLLLIIAVGLSIVRANGWIVVPTYIIVFSWILLFCGYGLKQYGCGIGEKLAEKVNKSDTDSKPPTSPYRRI